MKNLTKEEISKVISNQFVILAEYSNERGLISERPYLSSDGDTEARFMLHEQDDPSVVIYMFQAVLAINGSIQRGEFIRQYEK